jgi:hypothetical protein
MPGAHRTRSLACKEESTQASHHRYAETIRHSLRNGFTAYVRALPRRTGLDSHRRPPIIISALDPSVGGSGPHGFAVRIRSARLAPPTRPSHPCPRFLTIAKRPSCGRDARRGATDLPDGTSGIFFAEGLDRNSVNQHVGQISWDKGLEPQRNSHLAGWCAGWSLPQNGRSMETISRAPRSSPETERRQTVPACRRSIAMSFAVAFLICCSAAMFLAHAVDAYRAG